MDGYDYVLLIIEGEYATLKRVDNGEEMFIAMALLPPGVDVGNRVHYENFEFSLI